MREYAVSLLCGGGTVNKASLTRWLFLFLALHATRLCGPSSGLAGRKTANYIHSLMREAGLTYARPDSDNPDWMRRKIENAIYFLRSHGFQVGVSAEKYIDVEEKLHNLLTTANKSS